MPKLCDLFSSKAEDLQNCLLGVQSWTHLHKMEFFKESIYGPGEQTIGGHSHGVLWFLVRGEHIAVHNETSDVVFS